MFDSECGTPRRQYDCLRECSIISKIPNILSHILPSCISCTEEENTLPMWGSAPLFPLWRLRNISHAQYPSCVDFSFPWQWSYQAQSFTLFHRDREVVLSIISNSCWGPLVVPPNGTQSSNSSQNSHTARKLTRCLSWSCPWGLQSHFLPKFLHKGSFCSDESSV